MTAKSDFPPDARYPVRVTDSIGKVIRSSKNLAGVLRHAAKTPVNVVEIRDLRQHSNGHYGVAFHFDNRDTALTLWSDWRVLFDWLEAKRSWSVERISIENSLWESVMQEESAQVDRIRKSGTLVCLRNS